jgi:hypothetical protein
MLPQINRPGTLEQVITALEAVLKLLSPFETQPKWERLPTFGDWIQSAFNDCKPSMLIDPLGRVELRGWLATASGAGTTIAVLPIRYRPAHRLAFCVSAVQGARVAGHVDISTDGRVVWINSRARCSHRGVAVWHQV